MSVYPIGFSINKSKIVNSIPNKTRLLSPLIPGNLSTYIYNNEVDYYNNYKESYFGMTFRKGGWDCMRHYEILACGCIPLFVDLEHCPKNIMTLLPKDIILSSNKLYDKLKDYDSFDKIPEIDKDECNKYINKLLDYTNKNLTNDKIANYILNKVNLPNVKRILFLSGETKPDYLRCVTLTGFKEIFGTECHDYPKIPHIYTDYNQEDAKKCYGKGISYTRIIDNSTHNDNYDLTIDNDIENHNYDLIIYGSLHRGIPLWDKVNTYYKPNEIVFLCGDDWLDFNIPHQCIYDLLKNHGYTVFVRELADDNLQFNEP